MNQNIQNEDNKSVLTDLVHFVTVHNQCGDRETRGDIFLPSLQISLFLLTLMRNNKLPLSEGTWHRIAV